MMKSVRSKICLLIGVLILAAGWPVQGADTDAKYVVDPSWPHKQQQFKWGDMTGAAVDTNGSIWIFNRGKPFIQIYKPDGQFVRAWEDATFKFSHHLKIDHEGNIWTSDAATHVIQKWTPEGKLLLTLGTLGKAGCDENHFDKPTDMAITKTGDIFVSDGYGNTRVVHFNKAGKFVKEWGTRGDGSGQFVLPHTIAVDSKGHVYVGDRNSARIEVFDQDAKLLAVWSDLIMPWGLWVSPQDEIWVCGASPARDPQTGKWIIAPPNDQIVMKLTPDGKVAGKWPLPKGQDGVEKPGEVNWVHCIVLDAKGSIYLGDIKGKRIQKFVRREP
ncbi:MAG: peptidyl-alpha-hydroxyglycine alpha-amidating lyase family protein [Kiritimatiellae bacterium]|nr:peptidyl-alpha-hydroxyglycine alpha-amidating lyase family protein [Kiritimatiellia bacterium]